MKVSHMGFPKLKNFRYHQMGELWTLFEFASLLYLACNMVLDMDGSMHITGLIRYYDIFHINIARHKIKHQLKGKILLAKVTPAFGVTLDGMGKL